MIITSYNIRGLGGSLKKIYLRRIFEVIHPDIMLIQQTMSEAWKSCQFFLKLFPGWEVCATDARGRSGGILCIWNPTCCDFTSFSSTYGIMLVGQIKGFEEEVKILNVYGPYKVREAF